MRDNYPPEDTKRETIGLDLGQRDETDYGQCQYIACEADAQLKRRLTSSDTVRYFCADHDPLDNDKVAWAFERCDG